MVNSLRATIVKFALALALTLPVVAQTDADRERRLADLERKIRLLEPGFATAANTDFDQRLLAAERKIEDLLVRGGKTDAPEFPVTPPATPPPAPPPTEALEPGLPLQPLSVSGDYQNQNSNSETRLPVSGYMEAHFNKPSGVPGVADFHRFVLLFGHSFSSRIKFWSELELEHALVEGGEELGEIALEQAYLDFLITPRFNVRAGMVLTPIGIINERHEPPSFNGVERPFVETLIIPTTWRELGVGFTGDVGGGFRYRAYMLSALNPIGFSAATGIAEGRRSGFDAAFRNPAFAGRLEYAGLRRLTLGLSAYTGISSTPDLRVTPGVTIGSFDGRYSFRRFDFRALYANIWVSRTRELNLAMERRFGLNPNVARMMRGYYFEPAIHILPRRMRNDVALFARYREIQYAAANGIRICSSL